jgi:hypothetical protein
MDNGLGLWSGKHLREQGNWQYEGVCVELHLILFESVHF